MEQHQNITAQRSPNCAIDRSRRVRSRLRRSLIPLLAAAVALCAVVVWHRDATHIQKACDRLEPHLAPIRRYLARHHTLPLVYPAYPDLAPQPTPQRFRYLDKQTLNWARSAPGPTIIGYGPDNGLIVSPNGHAVAIYENGDLQVEWLPSRDLGPRLASQQARAAATPPN